MTFLEQLTGQKRKHSLDGGDASSVEEDFDVSNAFGDNPTLNSGAGTRVDNDELMWDFGSPTELEQRSPNLNSLASVEQLEWGDDDSVHTLERVNNIEWGDGNSVDPLEGGDKIDFGDSKETVLSQYPQASSSAAASAAEYSDAEIRQQLLEWRRHFVKPGERVKLCNECKFSGTNNLPTFYPDPKLVTREVRNDIDILKYKPEGGKPLFLCDFCGRKYEAKSTLVKHIKNIHRALKRLSDQERRQQLLEWRSHFLKPGEKAKLHTEIELPDKNKFLNFIPNPRLVTRKVRDNIDILEYNPKPLFLCDFCGSNYEAKESMYVQAY